MIYSSTNNYGEIFEISLNSIEKAKSFCNLANTFHAEIDIMQERHISDAKSIMAIFSYDLTAPIKVGIVTSYDPEIQRFKKEMEKYKWEK